MRDKRFVAEHLGGPLKKEQHYQLIKWACECAGHVLYLYGNTIDDRLINALSVAEEWRQGDASVGDARKASLKAHEAARHAPSLTAAYVARSVGHAVATAHAADHALGAALYALKAIKSAGKPVEEEMMWQDSQLPPEIKELVITAKKRENL